MIRALVRSVLRSGNARRIKAYGPRVDAINACEAEYARLSDAALRGRTDVFRRRIAEGATLDDVLVPAFATCREAARRAIGQRAFDVQLIGAMILHDGRIAEMKTGEGKTLAAALAAYAAALSGRGVHVVTANEYLARRDAEWMGRIYAALGLATGVIVHGLDAAERQAAYGCDVTYATASELGFDYLRDNMAYRSGDLVQRGHAFAIVDEVDSILIDEARAPLIISGAPEDRGKAYEAVDSIIPTLDRAAYEVDERQRTACLTEAGMEIMEPRLRAAGLLPSGALYDVENIAAVHHVDRALQAHTLLRRDRDYIVQNGEVVLVDPHTGRTMPGRRYTDGLHQALEAKEQLAVQPETPALASITFQNYFRLYRKLAGTTATAATEARELLEVYGLTVLEVPTNRPLARIDEDDEVYRTEAEKLAAIVALLEACRDRGQPALVGTSSIETSEQLAALLRSRGWTQRDVSDRSVFAQPRSDGAATKTFALLNARHEAREAYIVSQAGVPGAITIATNMAGRGTDIQLGGDAEMRIRRELSDIADAAERTRRAAAIRAEAEQLKSRAVAAGGLLVIGAERNTSRRIDDQLRGRAGRQGEPGRSMLLVSLEDDLMRVFGPNRLDGALKRHRAGEPVVHPWISKALARAQRKVEARDRDARSNILKFDDVVNEQRKVVFEQRLGLMHEHAIDAIVTDMRHAFVADLIEQHLQGAEPTGWNWSMLDRETRDVLTLDVAIPFWMEVSDITPDYVRDAIVQQADAWMAAKAARWGEARMRVAQRRIVMAFLDDLWLRHAQRVEQLRRGAPLRAHGRRDPLAEFKIEAFHLFEQMLRRLRRNVTAATMRVGFADEALALPPETEDEHDVAVPDHLVAALH
jgi:preprotein translocase subunit SecA